MDDSSSVTSADATATKTVHATSSSESMESTSIMPTSSDSVITDSVTTSVIGQTSLQTSSDVPFTDSTQFPMQHATQVLPGNQVPMATTDPVSFTSDEVQGQTSQSQLQSGNIQSSQSSMPGSSNMVNDISASDTVNTVQNTLSVIPTKSSDSQSIDTDVTKSASVSDKVSSVLAYDEAKNSAGDKSVLGVTKTLDNSVKPTDSVMPPVMSTSNVDILPSTSKSLAVMTGAQYSTDTPTTFSSAAQSLDTMSLKTTEVVPLPPTGKPLVPEASADSTILGGGLSDNIIYIGVPLCGFGILLLLIVCIVCIRRRKSKAKGSPAKNRVQDLWVNNSRQDVPLTSQGPGPEPNGGEAVLPDDIAKWRTGETSTGVRKRKVKKKVDSNDNNDDQKTAGLLHKEEGCTTYEAVFDYKGELSTHLQLKQGDLVRVHRKEAAGWWRGTVGDQTGWFPSNYVQAAPPDNFKTENEVEMHDDSHVTSFMVKKLEEPNHRQSYIVNEPNHRKSTLTEKEIEAEPIYCKIQPKDKRKSGTDRSNSTTPTKSEVLSPLKDISADTQYVALYPFVARVDTELTINKGDIVLCKECSDNNGWMRGINDSTKHEGWVPATYVKKVEKVEKPQLDLDPASYKQLEVNTNMDERQDLVGIVHRAVHTFSAEKAGDLEFDTGDHITVFQVLENGWWLGCKDKTVGWFPGTFVEMIDQPSASPSPSPASSNRSPSQSPVPSEDTQLLPDDISKNQPHSDIKPATPSKLKPVRKAPAPPTPKTPKSPESRVTDGSEPNVEKKPESRLPTPGSSRLPKMSRPKVAPPLPPTKPTLDHHDPLYESIDRNDHINEVNKNISEKCVPNNINSDNTKQNGPTSDGLYELIKQPDSNSNDVSTPKKDKIKPPVPKRYIKPKLVTVPKTEVLMPNKETLTKGLVNGDVMRLRSPPPPRPVAPKLGPIRAKLTEPKPLEDQIPSEEEDTYFNLTPQRKFDAFVCQDINEQQTEEETPYQRLSSFGSFGVSSFGKSKDNITLNQDEKLNKHNQIEEKDEEEVCNNKYVPQNAQVNIEKVNEMGVNGEGVPHDDRKTELKSVQAKVDHNVPNEISNEQKDLISDKTAENQPKAKTGIPVTPKLKASRLAPPKPVSAKISESHVVEESDKTAVEDSDKTVVSPVEKPSKLQKPTKIAPSSKIPLSPKESPKKKVEDSSIFQYPDTSQNTVEKSMKSTCNVDESVKKEKPKSENAENRPRTKSVEKKPHIESIENRPRTDSLEKRPRTESLEKGPHYESVENRPRMDSIENRQRTDSMEDRTRTDSFGKPPVAPKPKSGLPKLAKPKSSSKNKEESAEDSGHGKSPTDESKSEVIDGKSPPCDGKSPAHGGKSREKQVEVKPAASPTIPDARTRISESESDTDNKTVDDKTKTVSPGSKLPLSSAITHQSPKMRGRKSNIPSPGFRNKSLDRTDKTVSDHKLSESESDGPISPSVNLRQKPESPGPARKAPLKQLGSVEKQSLRNRSNSPAGRTGIPTTVRNRSNSPAPKPGGIPVAKTSSPASKSTPKNKQRGLVPPKKILNGQDTQVDNTNQSPAKQPESPGLDSPVIDESKELELNSTSPKPDRPSKPPRVQKQKSQDSKPPKHGKSLLPVIHKAMETGSGSSNGVSQTTPGTKPKRGIPVAKSARPATPKTPPADHGEDMKRTLYQAVRGYTAEIDGELTFSEGTFVKELSDCDRPGWYVGMLADGTTGLYPADHFKPSPVSAQSEA